MKSAIRIAASGVPKIRTYHKLYPPKWQNIGEFLDEYDLRRLNQGKNKLSRSIKGHKFLK